MIENSKIDYLESKSLVASGDIAVRIQENVFSYMEDDAIQVSGKHSH